MEHVSFFIVFISCTVPSILTLKVIPFMCFAKCFLLFIPFLTDFLCEKQPHIILIVADDLGYNDVSWHNPDIQTPHLERLARAGVILEQSYVQPICTPTRSALMTGRYPIHTGRQSRALMPEQPDGLSTQFTLMPEYLKRLGYHTHMVGKWHLGFCNESYLPTRSICGVMKSVTLSCFHFSLDVDLTSLMATGSDQRTISSTQGDHEPIPK